MSHHEHALASLIDVGPHHQPGLEDQIVWYDRKSQHNQRTFKRIKVTEIVAAALIPFISATNIPQFGVGHGRSGCPDHGSRGIAPPQSVPAELDHLPFHLRAAEPREVCIHCAGRALRKCGGSPCAAGRAFGSTGFAGACQVGFGATAGCQGKKLRPNAGQGDFNWAPSSSAIDAAIRRARRAGSLTIS